MRTPSSLDPRGRGPGWPDQTCRTDHSLACELELNRRTIRRDVTPNAFFRHSSAFLLGSGPHVTPDGGRAALHCALELGINYLDTAPTYGNAETGFAEEKMAPAITAIRDKVFLVTKPEDPSYDGTHRRASISPGSASTSPLPPSGKPRIVPRSHDRGRRGLLSPPRCHIFVMRHDGLGVSPILSNVVGTGRPMTLGRAVLAQRNMPQTCARKDGTDFAVQHRADSRSTNNLAFAYSSGF